MTAGATLFNQTLSVRPAGRDAEPRPAGLKKILVVGGGSAGWMTALLLGHSLCPRGVEVQVLESPMVGAIGVGEGSTPWLRGFFDSLGIPESEWMPPAHATYKCGISFDGWSTNRGFERYFHPFASMLDNLTMTQFVHNANQRRRGVDLPAHPDRYFIGTRLAAQRKAPKSPPHFPFDVWYGYHFDSVLLGQFLQRKAIERGVRYTPGHIVDVQRDERGDIASVRTADGETVAADFFVDCTGFAGLLLQKALEVPFVSFAGNLFNDSAIAMPTPLDRAGSGGLPSHTVSNAMRHGWMWQIPLTSRFGNGYVYASAFVSADEAERELRERLGLLDDDTPARHLKMKIGRVEKHWHRNCVAVGLSQGFIEPLEATALLFIQRTATALVEAIEQGDLGDEAQARFNQRINDHFEGTRDYIVTHYKINTRTDTEYWRANAANNVLSEPLRKLFGVWFSDQNLAPHIQRGTLGDGYPVFSWYCLLAGMGLFPRPDTLRAPTPEEARFGLEEIDDFLERSAGNFPSQQALLEAIPPKREGRALQVYFW